mgnify:CR=1 FL=1
MKYIEDISVDEEVPEYMDDITFGSIIHAVAEKLYMNFKGDKDKVLITRNILDDFMKNEEDAKALAEAMVEIGKLSGRDVSAVVSDMDQPLGFAVGNAAFPMTGYPVNRNWESTAALKSEPRRRQPSIDPGSCGIYSEEYIPAERREQKKGEN